MRFLLPIFSFAIAAVFGLASLTGCAKHSTKIATFGSSSELLAYGVYSAQGQDNRGMATKLSLNQNYTYSRKKFQGPCLLIEERGEWKSDQEAINFRLTEIRKRDDCNSEDWRVEKMDTPTSRMLRNVTTNSFDLLDQEDDASAQWIRFLKH